MTSWRGATEDPQTPANNHGGRFPAAYDCMILAGCALSRYHREDLLGSAILRRGGGTRSRTRPSQAAAACIGFCAIYAANSPLFRVPTVCGDRLLAATSAVGFTGCQVNALMVNRFMGRCKAQGRGGDSSPAQRDQQGGDVKSPLLLIRAHYCLGGPAQRDRRASLPILQANRRMKPSGAGRESGL